MDIDDLIRLERKVWDALVEGDPDADIELLAEDFLGVYPTGFAFRSDHVEQLADGPSVLTYQLSEARKFDISEWAVMLSYRADFQRASALRDGRPEVMYVSSLWCLKGERWINVFSQDTPAKP